MDYHHNLRNDQGNTMRAIPYLAIAGLWLMSGAVGAADQSAVLERAVGRVVLESDRYPLGSHLVSDVIAREYKSVKRLPERDRVRFFWSVLMNVPLDASYMTELVGLIANDCSK